MVDILLPCNISLPEPNISSTASDLPLDAHCFFHGWSSVIFTAFRFTYTLLLLPLSILILSQGLQKWRRSSCSSISHCDCFTYNSATMQLLGVVGCTVISCGIFTENASISTKGSYIFFAKWYGEILCHVLTCLERYVAVVHPITYLSFKSERGIRMRNVTVAFVWVFSVAGVNLYLTESVIFWELSFLLLVLVVISFFSVSVLWVLVRPGPGERGGDRKKVVQSKQRALVTIVLTLALLMVRVVFNVVLEVVYTIQGLDICMILISVYWFHLPSSLLLLILFLYKERKNMFKNRDFR